MLLGTGPAKGSRDDEVYQEEEGAKADEGVLQLRRLDEEDRRHDQEDRDREDEQVLQGLVAPEWSHGHGGEVSGPARWGPKPSGG